MSAAAAVAATRARSLDTADVRSCPPLLDQPWTATLVSVRVVADVSCTLVAWPQPVSSLSPKTAESRIGGCRRGLAAVGDWELSPGVVTGASLPPRYLLFIKHFLKDDPAPDLAGPTPSPTNSNSTPGHHRQQIVSKSSAN